MTYLFTGIKHLTEEAVSVIGIIKGKKGTDHQIKLNALHLIRSEDLHLEATRCDLTLWISSSNCYIVYQLFTFVATFVKMGNMWNFLSHVTLFLHFKKFLFVYNNGYFFAYSIFCYLKVIVKRWKLYHSKTIGYTVYLLQNIPLNLPQYFSVLFPRLQLFFLS